uniref:Uncharacterized protein n=1 Tax=Panagrolaimus sp. PS1159 TaxID=55785 RepID=A0AC35EZ89_9BILA
MHLINKDFGPIIFICHTFCYQKTATKLWNKTHFSPYKPCPISEASESPKKRPLTPETPIPKSEAQNPLATNPNNPTKPATNQVSPKFDPYSNPGNALNPPQPIQPNRSPISNDPTSSQPFYDWLTDRNPNNVKESEDILFRRR